MRILVLITVLTMLICSPSYAEPVTQHKDTEELMKLMKVDQILDHIKERFIFLGRQMIEANNKVTDKDDEQGLDLKYIKVLQEIIHREITWEKAKPSFIIVFENMFTESERADLLKFFRSPAGVAYRDKFPQLTLNMFYAGQELFPNILPELEKLIAEEKKATTEKMDKK